MNKNILRNILVLSACLIYFTLLRQEYIFAAVEFNVTYSRDPFIPVLPQKKVKESPSAQGVSKEEIIEPPKLVVQGLIWGTKQPQAIIENKVVGIGDKINDAKLLQIKKDGVVISYKGRIFTLKPQSSVINTERRPAGNTNDK